MLGSVPEFVSQVHENSSQPVSSTAVPSISPEGVIGRVFD